jgi:hypothetical protein
MTSTAGAVPDSRAKKLPRKILRNPSDERNPRISDPHKQRVRAEIGPAQETQTDRRHGLRQRRLRAVRQPRDRLLAADSDVVLRVAGGIVGIAAGIVRAEVRLSGGIDRLIGVAGGERERHESQKDRNPHSRPPVPWRRGRRTRELGVLGDQVQECKTRRLPQLIGGGFVATVPSFDAGDCGGGLRQAGIRKTLQFVAKKRTGC